VVLAADGSTPPSLNAFFPTGMTSGGGSCGHATIPATIVSTASIGPPTVSGGTIYWGYDNSGTTLGDAGVVTATYGSGVFSNVTTHKLNSTTPPQNGVPPLVGTYSFIAAPDALFFGNSKNSSYYSFSFSYGWNWTTTAFGGSTTLVGPMVVAKGLALGISGNSGQIYAYYKVSGTGTGGTLKWSYPGSDLGSISSPVTASDGMIYFSDSKGNEFQAIKPVAAATTPTMSWNFTGPTGLTPSVVLSGVSTEATIDANGIVYFGQSSGNVYALITDVGTAAAAVGTDWGKTGYDNCNSSNTAFNCQ
jgi:outer membrane protein assembly factor BamB